MWEQLATDQFDPWQDVPRQAFTPYSRLLISTAYVVISRVGCLGVTDSVHVYAKIGNVNVFDFLIFSLSLMFPAL